MENCDFQDFILQNISGLLANDEIILQKLAESSNSWDSKTIISIASVLIALASFWFAYLNNKRNEHLYLAKTLHEELNDILLTIYDLLDNPQWESCYTENQKVRINENFERLHSNFLKGNKYYIISSIPTRSEEIIKKIRGNSRRIMYFNKLKNRYVTVFKELKKASNRYGRKQPLYKYFQIAEYESLYKSFSIMDDFLSQ